MKSIQSPASNSFTLPAEGIESLPITIARARRLLGKDSKALSDTQVRELILSLSLIAKKYLEYSGSKNKLGIICEETHG